MANMRYYADLPTGETVESRNRADYDLGSNRKPRIYCPDRQAWFRVTRVVVRKSSPSLHECDARCLNANGRTMNCECKCGGKNHGKGSLTCN